VAVIPWPSFRGREHLDDLVDGGGGEDVRVAGAARMNLSEPSSRRMRLSCSSLFDVIASRFLRLIFVEGRLGM